MRKLFAQLAQHPPRLSPFAFRLYSLPFREGLGVGYLFQSLHLALHHDTLTAGEGKTTTHTVHLAESAFDAAVNHLMHFGAWFDVL